MMRFRKVSMAWASFWFHPAASRCRAAIRPSQVLTTSWTARVATPPKTVLLLSTTNSIVVIRPDAMCREKPGGIVTAAVKPFSAIVCTVSCPAPSISQRRKSGLAARSRTNCLPEAPRSRLYTATGTAVTAFLKNKPPKSSV